MRQKEAALRAAPGIAGAIIAGGQSQRMGQDKALLRFGATTLIEAVIARLAPQAATLFINANGDARRLAFTGLDIVADAEQWRGAGPLAGVCAALRFAQGLGWAELATAPCDAPSLPLDFVARLAAAKTASGACVAAARGPRGLEPMFALWSVSAVTALEARLARGQNSLREAIAALGGVEAAFAAANGGDLFANLNTPADVARAGKAEL